MEQKKTHSHHLNDGQNMLPSVSVDCVIFGFHDNQLKVLLLKFRNTDYWGLPSGYIQLDEDMDEAAIKILEETTGVKNIFLEQFYAFGQRERVDKKIQEKIAEAMGQSLPPDHWISKRFIAVGYYALVDFSQVTPTSDPFSDACDWFDIREMPELIFDHKQIVGKALETLRNMLDHKLVGFNLLPEMFTMSELQCLHETILDKKLVRANFQRKILSMDILERMDKKYTGGAHKAPYLYRFTVDGGR